MGELERIEMTESQMPDWKQVADEIGRERSFAFSHDYPTVESKMADMIRRELARAVEIIGAALAADEGSAKTDRTVSDD